MAGSWGNGPRRKELILAAIGESAASGRAPSLRELADAAGLRSISGVHRYLRELRAAGLIDWEPGRPRTLVLKDGQ